MAAARDSDLWDELKTALNDRLLVDGMVHLAPLADLYVSALRTASEMRELAADEPFTTLRGGRKLEHPAFVIVDREVKAALALAKVLGLNRPVGVPAKDADPYSAFDELGPRRRKRK
jgi:hypothetical protein